MSHEIMVIASLQVEGLHNWPDCDIEEVSYLKNPHRHVFHIKVKKRVSHGNREVEIIRLKREIKEYLEFYFTNPQNGILEFGAQSCEGIATLILQQFHLQSCEVLEDGENGAEVVFIDDDLTMI